ncbi:MAG TPA: M23 family metallopeptidase, partial [Thermaerobacter sp.]
AVRKLWAFLLPPILTALAFVFLVLLFAGAVSGLLLEMGRAHAFDGNPGNPENAIIRERYENAARAVWPGDEELQPFAVPWELLAALDMVRGLPLENINPEALARRFRVTASYAELTRTVHTRVYRDGVLVSDRTTKEPVRVLETVRNWEGTHRLRYVMTTRTEESTRTEYVTDEVYGRPRAVTVRTVRTITEPVRAGWSTERDYGQLRAVMAELGLPDDDLFVVLSMHHAMTGEEGELVLSPDVPVDGSAPAVPVVDLPQSPEGWTWPVASTRITSPFGPRFHPIKRRWKLHAGVDVGIAYQPVHAARSGVVVRVAFDPDGYGQYVDIQHGQGYMTRYGHLTRGQVFVLPGQAVKAGQLIAISGNTGASTGPHLHFEIRHNGAPVDPLLFYPNLR